MLQVFAMCENGSEVPMEMPSFSREPLFVEQVRGMLERAREIHETRCANRVSWCSPVAAGYLSVMVDCRVASATSRSIHWGLLCRRASLRRKRYAALSAQATSLSLAAEPYCPYA